MDFPALYPQSCRAEHEVMDLAFKTCLLVDDDVFDRMHMRRVMERQHPDIQLFEMDSLSDARAFLETRHTDIILLDNRLPDGSGADFASELRSKVALRDTAIFVVSNGAIRSVDDGVKAMSKDELSARSLGVMIDSFMEQRRVANSTETAELLAEFGLSVRDNFAPIFARLIRTLRAARTDITLEQSETALEKLGHVEEILLAVSQVVSGKSGQHH